MEKKTRDKAIKTLSIFLSDDSRDEIPSSEMAKLWKGIFYCFWMSDKPLVQQALASELASLVLCTPNPSSALSFLNGFWETIVREWNGIDRLRPTDGRVPVGLVYHIADVYLEELEKVVHTSTESPRPVPLFILLSPFLSLAAQTPLSATYKHLQTSLLEPLLSSCSEDNSYENDDPEPQKKRKQPDSNPYSLLVSNACLDNASSESRMPARLLRKKILRRIFELASHPETRDANRRKMYALWKLERDDDEDENESDTK
ncbi:hypothetical protein D9757_004658 [Collybiopsis confluens]|uniref:Nop52-domain-containing protein n=1 Tax=Collybiopsis confluens TaxID=2823264 RepID=A0A8H5MC82_9AGAR|nr:hypothetical protein D9757_004658 [Collybiopsis confluens]